MSRKSILRISALVAVVGITVYFLMKEEELSASEIIEYEGPNAELDDIRLLYSDSAQLKVMVTGDKQLELQNGNREFPEGIYVEFYDEQEKLSSTLKADYGIIDKQTEIYTVIGNVEVVNQGENQKLNTEELNWNPKGKSQEQLYTDKTVRIADNGNLIVGEGMTADQNFNKYTIKKVTGEFNDLD